MESGRLRVSWLDVGFRGLDVWLVDGEGPGIEIGAALMQALRGPKAGGGSMGRSAATRLFRRCDLSGSRQRQDIRVPPRWVALLRGLVTCVRRSGAFQPALRLY
jgi:hypothetical protein